MDEDEALRELCEDFSAPGPDEPALERILAHARTLGDADLRRLVHEVRYWRFLAPALLDRLAPRGTPVDRSDPLLVLARFQIRGEGGIGSKKG